MWSKAQPDSVWLPVTDVVLVIEIISPGSNEYIVRATVPLAWVLNTSPAEYNLY